MAQNTLKEVEEVGQLPIISRILELICTTTGMRFAAVARVTSSKWIALAVQDKLNFGVKPGDEFELGQTLCSEVRQYEKPVVIDSVRDDQVFKDNPIPAAFGFQSHISVPIFRGDNEFYGTLCAVDPEPNDLKNERIGTLFSFLAELISNHLETVDLLKSSKKDLKDQLDISTMLESVIQSRTADLKRNVRELARSNQELKDFSYIASHDLQEPLRKIQTYVSFIDQNDHDNLPDRVKKYFARIMDATERMRRLINDLLAYSIVQSAPTQFETLDLDTTLSEVLETLSEEIKDRHATVHVGKLGTVSAFPYQIRQLFQNLIGNALKYSRPDVPPVIDVKAKEVLGKLDQPNLEPERKYCKVTVKDNGIGFDQQFATQIFQVFERLHGRTDYSGTGIGLAIVRKIVENHQGYISARSVLGEGSEFTVWLPVER